VRVSELFYSIQGEGKLIGVPSVFVRASGCNLRCTWCDTPYASWNPEGDDRAVERIVRETLAFGAKHVVLTGGEPMIMPDIAEIAQQLHASGLHITIETAATLFKPVHVHLASLSPKLSNSTPHEREGGRFAQLHDKQRTRPDVIAEFIDHVRTTGGDYQLKFVVSEARDLDEIDVLLGTIPTPINRADVLLMPEGTDAATLRARASWLGEVCKQRGFRYCPRLHVELYGNQRGT
jgi:7-carboxy-7-deazaguanine synthase